MRDNVMGIEAVLADGTIWDGRRALVKDSSGYDLKHLFIGGEGTLGIVTSAVLKLRPATPYETSLLAITGLGALAPLLDLAQQHAPGTVTAFELMPLVAIDRVVDVFDVVKPLDTDTEYFALIKLASSNPVDGLIAAFLEAGAEAGLIVDAAVAGTPEQEANLWAIRDHIPDLGLHRTSAPWAQARYGSTGRQGEGVRAVGARRRRRDRPHGTRLRLRSRG